MIGKVCDSVIVFKNEDILYNVYLRLNILDQFLSTSHMQHYSFPGKFEICYWKVFLPPNVLNMVDTHESEGEEKKPKVLIDFLSASIVKEMHVGHLR